MGENRTTEDRTTEGASVPSAYLREHREPLVSSRVTPAADRDLFIIDREPVLRHREALDIDCGRLIVARVLALNDRECQLHGCEGPFGGCETRRNGCV